MSKPISSYPKYEQAEVVERRRKPTAFGKGLGYVSALFYRVRRGSLTIMDARKILKGEGQRKDPFGDYV